LLIVSGGKFIEVIISGIVGLITGTIASLIAPWVQWGIEKSRSRIEYRRTQIKRWRDVIESFDFDSGISFGDTSIYAEIRPYLETGFVNAFEGRTFFASGGRGSNHVKHKLLDSVSKQERKWDLI